MSSANWVSLTDGSVGSPACPRNKTPGARRALTVCGSCGKTAFYNPAWAARDELWRVPNPGEAYTSTIPNTNPENDTCVTLDRSPSFYCVVMMPCQKYPVSETSSRRCSSSSRNALLVRTSRTKGSPARVPLRLRNRCATGVTDEQPMMLLTWWAGRSFGSSGGEAVNLS